eukprot:g8743.t1
MASFAKDLMAGQGCTVDGLTQSRNPMGNFVDAVFQGPQGAKGQMVGPRRSVSGPGATMHAAMREGFQGNRTKQINPRTGPTQNWGNNFTQQARVVQPPPQVMQQQRARTMSAPTQNWGAEFKQTPNVQYGEARRMKGRSSMQGPGGAMRMQTNMMMRQQTAMAQHSMMMQQTMIMAQQQQMMMAQQMQPQQQMMMQQPYQRVQESRPEIKEITHEDKTSTVVKNDDQSKLSKSEMNATRLTAAEMTKVLSQDQDPKYRQSEFFQFMSQIRDNEVEFAGNKVIDTPEKQDHISGVWDQPPPQVKQDTMPQQQSMGINSGANMNMSTMNSMTDKMSAAWRDNMDGKKVNFEQIWQEATNQIVNQSIYTFAETNKFKEQSNLFQKGIELFNEGEIRDAILAFQAHVQHEVDDSSEGWRMLGKCHQEHDEDRQAIECLKRAVEEDPYNLDALLDLGVSYVNELDSQNALETLKGWIDHHPSFQGMKYTPDAYSDGTLMDEIMQLMLQAREFDATDPDVHIVLGVLYNVSRDFDSAVASLRQALSLRPNDYSLWNKLGATQANGNRGLEAMPAYEKALQMKPKYARAWLNMGISYANLGNYSKAVRGYLKALKLNPQASHVWSYLRIAFTCMERFDLLKLVDERNVDLFKEFL